MGNEWFDHAWKLALSLISSAALAVAALWKANESKNSRAISIMQGHVDDCLEDRQKIRRDLDDTIDTLTETTSELHETQIKCARLETKLEHYRDNPTQRRSNED
jgi:peptidoglycan hydrolase CwlO-like protein